MCTNEKTCIKKISLIRGKAYRFKKGRDQDPRRHEKSLGGKKKNRQKRGYHDGCLDATLKMPHTKRWTSGYTPPRKSCGGEKEEK